MTVNPHFHALLPVPAGSGLGMLQGKLNGAFLVSQNKATSGNPNVVTWRLLLFVEGQSFARYFTHHGEKCSCGNDAQYSAGRWNGEKYVDIHDVCEDCLDL